jgi:hypothetical protein
VGEGGRERAAEGQGEERSQSSTSALHPLNPPSPSPSCVCVCVCASRAFMLDVHRILVPCTGFTLPPSHIPSLPPSLSPSLPSSFAPSFPRSLAPSLPPSESLPGSGSTTKLALKVYCRGGSGRFRGNAAPRGRNQTHCTNTTKCTTTNSQTPKKFNWSNSYIKDVLRAFISRDFKLASIRYPVLDWGPRPGPGPGSQPRVQTGSHRASGRHRGRNRETA